MSKQSDSREYSSSSSESEEVEWNERKSEANDWLDLIDKNCTKNTKTNRKLEEKRVKELNEQKIRDKRELNPYYASDGRDGRDEGPSVATHSLSVQSTGSCETSLKERNGLNAKLLKAELMGNQTLVKQIKDKLKQLESNESRLTSPSDDWNRLDNNREQKLYSIEKTSNEESMSLKEMYFREKQSTAEEENKRFVATTSKSNRYPEEEYEESHRKKRKHKKESNFRYVRQEDEDKDNCKQCVRNIDKQLILSIGEKTVIILTPFEPFVKGMCFILSKCHSNVSTVSSDEQCLQEINERKHEISKLFAKHNLSVIFMETYFKRSGLSVKHLMIECIPIKSKYENESKIFFKKAIMECEGEWAINKQVIQIKDKPITKLVPKGLSYFWVTFGAKNDGFAHVIENIESFSHNFGKEVIGGLLDIEPNKWLKPKHQSYEQQYERIVKLKNQWKKTFEKN